MKYTENDIPRMSVGKSYVKGSRTGKQVVTSVHYFLCLFFQSLSCKPVASLDHFTPEMLGTAELVEEVQTGDSKLVKVSEKL